MRSRNLKPGYFKNEDLSDCDPLARILFAGLWCMADREGRLEYRPKRIKAELLPYDNCEIVALLNQLATNKEKFITIYSFGDCDYIQINNFGKHQNPHVREPESSIPAPDKNCASTVLVPDEHRTGPADSLFLIPDSLLPISDSSTVSGKPDDPKDSVKENAPYQEIIGYLNLKANKSFRATSKEAQKYIKARWNAGFRLSDFMKVIDNKSAKWATDPKMVDYLRPETLFGTKFESYLNEAPARDGPGNVDNNPATFDFTKRYGDE